MKNVSLDNTTNAAREAGQINPQHIHAVAHFESDFGKKIKYIVRTYASEREAVHAVRNGDKGGFPTRILCGQAYARLVDGEWMLGQASRDWANE